MTVEKDADGDPGSVLTSQSDACLLCFVLLHFLC